ncbi:MAG TPA: efflux RND transporter periplasmic adaptor subunit [Polyangia bacterium]|jgi:cobalt-zinc-cadmium efflux system membrane fusion protein|nr:efflux RND transporter periplasmic adaptor subunit [Polyangia bacterium]
MRRHPTSISRGSALWAAVLGAAVSAACATDSREAGARHKDAERPPGEHPGEANAPRPQTPGQAAGEHQDEPGAHEELPSKIRLPATVVTAAGIKMAPARLAPLPATVSLTGQIVADPDRSALVALRIAGRIVDVRFREGERVRRGAVLAVVESTELARARADYTAAKAKAAAARQNAERLLRVADKGLAAGQEVATAEAEARSLQAQARAAEQTLSAFGPGALDAESDAARLALRAPIDGDVLRRDAVRGQTVKDEHVIAEIADLDRAYFLARLFEKDLARVKPGAAAEVRLNGYPDDVFQGNVEAIGKQLDPAARTVTARILLQNRNDLLKVGLFGMATVVDTSPTAAAPRLVVPLGAVTKIADREVVFVRQPDGDFEVHPVTLGRSAAGRVEVLSGLRAGELVVVEGVFTLKSAVLKGTFGEEE